VTFQAVEFDPFRGGEVSRTTPSTEPQREIITSAAFSDVANTAFNEAVSLRLSGDVNPEAVEAAFQQLVTRHEALRMTFTPRGDELILTDRADFTLERLDFRAMPGAEQEARIQALWRRLAGTPMSLTEGPLFRAVWIELAPREAELVLLAHHVICDGWSFHVILEELAQLVGGADPRSMEPAPSFAEFAERQAARNAANADADYWHKQFQSRPPVLDLPTDAPRPAFRTFDAARLDFTFESDLVKAIATAAGKNKASVVNVVLAGTAVLLHRLSGVTDLAIGLPVARQGSEGLPGLVGHGVQLLPIRLRPAPEMKFQELIAQAKGATLDAREHFDFTFGTLVRDLGLSGDPSRVPLVPVIFNIDQPFGSLKIGAATATLRTVPRVAENFELFLNVVPSKETLVVEATFNTALFSGDTIRAWMAALEALLYDATADVTRQIGALALSRGMPAVYERVNDTAVDIRDDSWLDSLARLVAARPSSQAVEDSNGSATYAEVLTQAKALASSLAARGVTSGSIIGLHLTRTREMPVFVAAVHMLRAAYVPLDPSFPDARLAYMVRDSGAQFVLSDGAFSETIAEAVPILRADELRRASAPEPEWQPVRRDDLAYILYTSGSTGQPKGVEVTHGSVANFLASMRRRPGFSSSDKLLAVTTLSFDISVLELFLPLTAGGTTVVASRDESGDARRLAAMLEHHSITTMQATPSTWRLLLRDGWAGRPQMTALCGGEPLPPDLVPDLRGKVKALWNMFGPTETTVWSTCKRLEGDGPITVGTPIDNTAVYIADDRFEPLPPAVPGEILIGGAGLARGYHNRAAQTAERFIEHPRFGRLYRTGDRGRMRPDGEILHLGRLDDQVKVRGFRIELGEIESVLAEHPDVQQAAVKLWVVKEDDVRLVACCVPRTAGTFSTVALRKHIRSRLPEYMVPQYFLPVDAIPVSPAGKVDRDQLPLPIVTESRVGKAEAPADPVEATIASIWAAVVRPSRPLGRQDRFFEIGGHSLLGLEVLRRVNEKFGVRLHPRVLYLETLAEIAARCRVNAADGTPLATGPKRLATTAEILLTENQERIYREWKENPQDLRYNLPYTTRLTGSFDLARFRQAFEAVFDRQAALRTVIGLGPSGPVQRIRPVAEGFALETVDLASSPDPEGELTRLLTEATHRPFDLERGPVMRAVIYKLGPSEHQLFLMPHEILFDGWSFDLVLAELSDNYARLEAGDVLSWKPLEITYGDFATWHRAEGSRLDAASQEYWRTQLNDLPRPIDWPGAATVAGQSLGRVSFTVPRDRMGRFDAFCAEQKVGPQDVILAALARTLGDLLRRDDLVIDLASSGRFLPEIIRVVGLFFSMLPVRFSLRGHESSSALVQAIHAQVQGSVGFQNVTLHQLDQIGAQLGVGDRRRRQVSYSYQDAKTRAGAIGSLVSQQGRLDRPATSYEMEFWVRNVPEGIVGFIDHQPSIASPELMDRFRQHFLDTLQRIVEGTLESRSAEGVWPVIEPEQPKAAKRGIFGWKR
jgi:amino acid adenylation domain-containing protein